MIRKLMNMVTVSLVFGMNIATASNLCDREMSDTRHFVSKDGPFKIISSIVEGEMGVNSQITLDILLCDLPDNATVINAEAIMPMHQHGMNYQPNITQISDKIFRAEPYVFHMPGKWQLQTNIKSGEKILEFKEDLIVLP